MKKLLCALNLIAMILLIGQALKLMGLKEQLDWSLNTAAILMMLLQSCLNAYLFVVLMVDLLKVTVNIHGNDNNIEVR